MIFVQPRHFVVEMLKCNFILVPLPDGVEFVTFSHIYICDGKSEKHIKMAETRKEKCVGNWKMTVLRHRKPKKK